MLSAMEQAPTAQQVPADELKTTDQLAVGTRKAAHLLDVSRRKLMELIYEGEIATTQIPSKAGRLNEHRIEISEIKAFLARNRRKAAS